MYHFLQQDYDALVRKKVSLILELRTSGQDIGEAGQQSSETWHDNAPLEVAQREFERLHKRLEEIDKIVQGAEIVQVETVATTCAGIGSEVTFRNQDGKEQTVKIGSYVPEEGSISVSYVAPIAKMLLGAHVGDIVEGKVAGRDVELEIMKIARWI